MYTLMCIPQSQFYNFYSSAPRPYSKMNSYLRVRAFSAPIYFPGLIDITIGYPGISKVNLEQLKNRHSNLNNVRYPSRHQIVVYSVTHQSGYT